MAEPLAVRAIGLCSLLGLTLLGCELGREQSRDLGVFEIEVPPGIRALRAHHVSGVERPVDVAFAQGAVYVLGGRERAQLYRLDLLGEEPQVQELPLPDSRGLPLAVEILDEKVIMSGTWGRHLLVLSLEDGEMYRRTRYPQTDRMAVTSTGAVVTPDPEEFLGFVLRTAEPAAGRSADYSRPFGYLPVIDGRPLVRITWNAARMREAFVAVTHGDTVHILGDREGAMVTFSPNGRTVRMGSLYGPALSHGLASVKVSYGRPPTPVANSFSSTCAGELLVSVGRDIVRGFEIDPATYQGRQLIAGPFETIGGRRLSLCGRYLAAFSPEARGMRVWELDPTEARSIGSSQE